MFALKHRLWVLTICVLSKNKKIVKQIQLKIVNFTAVKNLCMSHGRVFVMVLIVPVAGNRILVFFYIYMILYKNKFK